MVAEHEDASWRHGYRAEVLAIHAALVDLRLIALKVVDGEDSVYDGDPVAGHRDDAFD